MLVDMSTIQFLNIVGKQQLYVLLGMELPISGFSSLEFHIKFDLSFMEVSEILLLVHILAVYSRPSSIQAIFRSATVY